MKVSKRVKIALLCVALFKSSSLSTYPLITIGNYAEQDFIIVSDTVYGPLHCALTQGTNLEVEGPLGPLKIYHPKGSLLMLVKELSSEEYAEYHSWIIK